MSRVFMWSLIASLALASPLVRAAQQPRLATPLGEADERFKTDILLVVAHPDDEGAATPYLARAIDEGKRVAVAYGTLGNSGANEAGAEQAAALGDIREIEARRACASLGITHVWFLGGKDTASQDVLASLASWGEGSALENLVRLVRLTRPEVILTFLPGTFIGEDHGDHQASGVLATEAFDLAGDPAVFPSQVAVPLRRLEPYLENLRPWQTKKIYYFPDADREDIFRGLGPQYSVRDLSKSGKPYWRLALDEFLMHETQARHFGRQLEGKTDAQIEKMAADDGWHNAISFVLGKSLVGGTAAGDIFERVRPGSIPFVRPAAAPVVAEPEFFVELAGPWKFYADFRREHALTHLPHPEPPEIALQGGSTLVIPLLAHNGTSEAKEITLTADLPAGWSLRSGTGRFAVSAKQTASTRVEIDLPAVSDDSSKEPALQEVTIRAESNGKPIGAAKLRVEVRSHALPE